MKKRIDSILSTLRLTFWVIVSLLLPLGLQTAIRLMWINTQKPILYFLNVLMETCLTYVLTILFFILVQLYKDDKNAIIFSNKAERIGSLWKDKECRKWVIGFWGIVFAIFLIAGCFSHRGKYGKVLTEGKRPNKITYLSKVLSDAVSRETVRKTFSSEVVDYGISSYYSGVTTIKSTRREAYNCYIYFGENEEEYKVPQLDASFILYILDHKEEKEQFTIEYYKKSGVIISIDGYTLQDLREVYSDLRK